MLFDFSRLFSNCSLCIKLVTTILHLLFTHTSKALKSIYTPCIKLATSIHLLITIELLECMKFCSKRVKFYPDLEQVSDNLGCLQGYTIFFIIFIAYLFQQKRYNTVYYLLHSLVKHSSINLKSLTFNYLDEKLIDTDLI